MNTQVQTTLHPISVALSFRNPAPPSILSPAPTRTFSTPPRRTPFTQQSVPALL